MPKVLTRNQYYKSKNIPAIVYCKKLAPELSLKNHILDPLPRLATQVRKIYSNCRQDNQINLELANALKIIKELEDELDVLNNQKIEVQQLLFLTNNEKQQLGRNMERLKSRIVDLEGLMNKNELTLKKFYEEQLDKHKYELREHKKKISQMLEQNKSMQQKSNQQKQQIIQHYRKQFNTFEQQKQSIQNHSTASFKQLQNNYGKINSQNTEYRRKIYELEEKHQQQLLELQKQLEEQITDNKQNKSQYEQKIITLNTECQILKSTVVENQNKIQVLESRLMRENQGWVSHKDEWVKTLKQNQQRWKEKIDYVMKEKEKVLGELAIKGRQINEYTRQVSNLEYELTKFDLIKDQFVKKIEQKEKEKQQIRKQLEQNFSRQLQIRQQELTQIIQHDLYNKNNSNMENLRKQLHQGHEKTRLKLTNKINKLEHDKAETEHNNRLLQDQIKKLKFKITTLEQENGFRKCREQENKQYYENKYGQLERNYESELEKGRNFHSQALQNLRSQYQDQIQSIKQYFNQDKQQVYSKIDQLTLEKKYLEDQLIRAKQTFQNNQKSYIQQIQTLTKKIQTANKQKQALQIEKNQVEENLKKKQAILSECEYIMEQEQKENHQLCQQMKELCKNKEQKEDELRRLMEQNGKINSQKSQLEIDNERIKVLIDREGDSSRKKEKQLLQKIKDLEQQKKWLQTQKSNLRSNMTKNDEQIKIHYEKLRKQFMDLNQKYQKEVQQRQQQLKLIIQQLKIENSQLQTKQSHQMQQSSWLVSQWSNKCNLFEDKNKKLEIEVSKLRQIANSSSQKDKQIRRLTQLDDENQKQINSYKLQVKQLKHKIQCLEYEQDRLITDRKIIQSTLKNTENRVNSLEDQRNNLIKSIQKLEYEIQIKSQQRKQQINKLNGQLKKVSQSLEEQRIKFEQELANWEKQVQQKQVLLKVRVEEIHNKNKQEKKVLQAKLEQLKQTNRYLEGNINRMRSETEHLIIQKNSQYEEIHKRHQELQITVFQYEKRLEQVRSSFSSNRAQYQSQKNKNIMLMKEIVSLKERKSELEQQVMRLRTQGETKSKLLEENQEYIKKIYQEHDQRLQIYRKQFMDIYNAQLTQKSNKINMLQQARRQAEEDARRQAERYHDQIRQMTKNNIKKMSEKDHRITELTLEIEALNEKYKAVTSELGYMKVKLQKFCFDQQQNKFKKVHEHNEYKTQEKKVVRIVNQTNLSTHQRKLVNESSSRIHRNIHNSVSQLQRKPPMFEKQITKLLDSDSDVINSQIISKSEVEESKSQQSHPLASQHSYEQN